MGDMVPKNGSGKGLAKSLVAFTEEREAETSNLQVLLSDSCPKMSGWKTGTHTHLEKHFKRPMQRVYCISHAVKKPFEHLFQLL